MAYGKTKKCALKCTVNVRFLFWKIFRRLIELKKTINSGFIKGLNIGLLKLR